jgi:threonylcarbamoyladenosine tRNA methylthiotransferase MtaB
MIVATGCYPNVENELKAMIPEIGRIVTGAEKDRLPEIVSAEFFRPGPCGASLSNEAEEKKNCLSKEDCHPCDPCGASPVPETKGKKTVASEQTACVDAPRQTARADRTRAFLKIEDGCDRHCAYCIIPLARGGVRSEEKSNVMREFRRLLGLGYKEIVLTGINIALFSLREAEKSGKAEMGGNPEALMSRRTPEICSPEASKIQETPGEALTNLLRELVSEPGDFRLRLGSLEPNVLAPAAIEEIAGLPKLCPDYHISLQSGSDRVLASMGRGYRMEDFADTVRRLRSIDPLVSISTDIITGFPGETEEDHLASLRAVEEMKFSRVHIFKFSKRKGTRAFSAPSQIGENMKSQRSRELALAAEISAESFLRSNAGKTRRALILNRDGTGKFRALTDNGIDIRLENTHTENTFEDITLAPGMLDI